MWEHQLWGRVKGAGRETAPSMHGDYGISFNHLWALERDSPGFYQFGALSLSSWRTLGHTSQSFGLLDCNTGIIVAVIRPR